MGTNLKKVQRVDFTFVRNNNNKNKNKKKNKNLTKKINLYSYKLLGNALWGLFWYILAQNKDDLTEYEDDQKRRRPPLNLEVCNC